jgi:hypothetical protein
MVAYQSTTPVSGQFPTVTVTREAVPEGTTSDIYSDASIQAVTSLPGYELIDREEAEVDNQGVEMHIFSAQPRVEEPALRFYQLSAASGTAGYTLTAAVPLSVDDALVGHITLILRNLTFVAPQGE